MSFDALLFAEAVPWLGVAMGELILLLEREKTSQHEPWTDGRLARQAPLIWYQDDLDQEVSQSNCSIMRIQ